MRRTQGSKGATDGPRESRSTSAWRLALAGLGAGFALGGAQAPAFAQSGGAQAPSLAQSSGAQAPVPAQPRAAQLPARAPSGGAASAKRQAAAPLPASPPASVPSVNTPPPALPVENSDMDSALLYQLLLAEFDRTEGQTNDAIDRMLEAARRRKDDALFRRSLEIAVEAGAGDKALAITKTWRQTSPKSVEAVRTEVQLLFKLSRVNEVAEPLRQLLALSSPGERAALIASLPRVAQRAQDRKATADEFRRLLTPYLDDPDTRTAARVALARMRLAEGQPGAALELARTAQSLDPKALGPVLLALDIMNNASAIGEGDGASGAEPASSAPAPAASAPDTAALARNLHDSETIVRTYLADPQAEPLVRQAYASILLTQQRLTDAAEQLRLALKLKPKQAQLWQGLGEIELELRHPDEAEAALKQALALVSAPPAEAGSAPGPAAAEDDSNAPPDASDAAGPSDEAEPMAGQVRLSHVQLLLARAAEMRHDDATASQWLSQVDAKDADLQVIALRASLLARQGKLAEARAMVRAAPANTPTDRRYRLLTEVQLLLDNHKLDDARLLLGQANAQTPDDVDLLYQEAMVDERLDRVDDMESLLRRVLALQPGNSQALNALGYSLADRNLRLDEALDFVQRAHALAPGDPFIVDSLGWGLFRLGRYGEAADLLNQAYASRKDTEIAAHLGEALWADGKHDQAVQVLRDARRRDAANEVLKQTMARLKVAP